MDTVLFTDHGILVFATTTGAIAFMLMLAVLGLATTHRTRSDIEHQWLPGGFSAGPINRQLGNIELNEWNLLLNRCGKSQHRKHEHERNGGQGPTGDGGTTGNNKSGRRIFRRAGLKTRRKVKQPCPAKTNYSSSRGCSICKAGEWKHAPQNRRCSEWANTTKTKPPMRRIATLNENGNSGSSIATPSRLHKRGRAQAAKNLLGPPRRTQKLVCASRRLLAGIARKIESYNSGS
jgi:hypothetical protein